VGDFDTAFACIFNKIHLMSNFANRLIAWQKIYGRHNLPWQNTTDPYAIWISEIMLQQTQVSTVISYYSKFMLRFPNIASLANSTQDEVLQHWSGLGYYSRARNLHNAAVKIMVEHGGQFPRNFEMIQTLSGIGRSTAAAIASFAFNQRQTILDGNVKRVLARHFLIEGSPNLPKVESQLWQLAESLLPKKAIVSYTQGLMDLGATLCTRSNPKCTICPLNESCKALQQQRVHEFPTPKPRKTIPEKSITLLILLQGEDILFEKRPSTGIWGGLWSFPEVENSNDIKKTILEKFGLIAEPVIYLSNFTHTFTHFKLHINPQILNVIKQNPESSQIEHIWININDAFNTAIPTPIRKILQSMQK
jgi:A/G-specific adenine glycosylase